MPTRTIEANLRYAPGSLFQTKRVPWPQRQCPRRKEGILLNFAGVEFISSAGIAMIIGLIIQATKAGRRLLACNLSDHYIKIFQTARLSDYINVFPSEAAALDGNQGSEFQI